MKWINTVIRNIYSVIPFKKPMFEFLRSHFRLPPRLYQHLHFVAPISVPISAGQQIKMHHFGAGLENELFWAGYGNCLEATSLRLWLNLVAGCDTVFDIGANTGVYALAAKAVNEKAKVFAFEPVASIANILQRNVELNRFDITVVREAASGLTGEATLLVPNTSHSYSASLEASMLPGEPGLVKTVVPTIAIHDFIKKNKLQSADVFKIDVEKHEVAVLSGFGDVIEKFRPTLLIEILDQDHGKQVKEFFAGLKYVYYEIIEGKEARRVQTLDGSTRNYLICPEAFAELKGMGEIIRHDALTPGRVRETPVKVQRTGLDA